MMLTGFLLVFSVLWALSYIALKLKGGPVRFTTLGTCNLLDLGDISGTDECADPVGGLAQSTVYDCDSVCGVIVDEATGCVLSLGLTDINAGFTLTPDDDDTAFYNQEGSRDGNKIEFTQSAFYKFAGITEERVRIGNALKGCCCLVAVHCTNSGAILIQGIDPDVTTAKINSAYKFTPTKGKLKATVNLLTDTGDNEDRLEITLESTARCLSYIGCTPDADGNGGFTFANGSG